VLGRDLKIISGFSSTISILRYPSTIPNTFFSIFSGLSAQSSDLVQGSGYRGQGIVKVSCHFQPLDFKGGMQMGKGLRLVFILLVVVSFACGTRIEQAESSDTQPVKEKMTLSEDEDMPRQRSNHWEQACQETMSRSRRNLAT
jgi:hypothetical protein